MAQVISFEAPSWDIPEAETSAKLPFTPLQLELLKQTPLPHYDEGIEQVKTIPRHDLETPFGIYWQRSITMSDGQRHTELVGISKDSSADTVAVSVPAWWTSPTKGFNYHTSVRLHKAGIHTLIKGIAENSIQPLSRGAYDVHVSLDYDDGFGYYFDPDDVLVHGDSNGAMQGTGIIAYAAEMGRNIRGAFLTDPCIVRPIDVRDVEKFIRHPSYLPKELISLGRQALRIASKADNRPLELLETIDLSKEQLIGNLALSFALFSGEFGHLAAHLPPEQNPHFLLLKHSLANQKGALLQILESINSQATKSVRTGTHLSIANPHHIDDKVAHLTARAHQLKVVA